MKQLCMFFCVLMGVTFFINKVESAHPGPGINWITSYDEAVNLASSTSKPIVLFFTGSDWCGWCNKLDQESLETPEFAHAVGDKFIFVKLDFPVNRTLPPQIASQNKQLQKRFNVRGFPTLVILDPQQNQIGTLGYRPGGGRAFAEQLLKIMTDYSSYKQKMGSMDQHRFSGAELKKLYETAQTFGYENDTRQIIQAGMTSSESQFFMIERYRTMASEGLLASPEAISLKQDLMKQDPNNDNMIQYHLALIDFEAANNESMDKEKGTPEAAVAALMNYIDKFGAKDKENLWRLQMIISQVYFDKNNLDEALKFAESSYASAPPAARIEISMAIKNIQSQLSTTHTAFVN